MLVLYFALFIVAVNSATVSVRNTTAPTSEPTIFPSTSATAKSKRGASDTTHAWNTKAINHSKSNNPAIPSSAPVQRYKPQSGATRNPESRYGNARTQQNVPYGNPHYASSQPYRNVETQASSSGYQGGFRPSFTQTTTTNNPVHYVNSPPTAQQVESQQNSHVSLPYYDALFNNPKVYNGLADSGRSPIQVKQIPETQAFPGSYHQLQSSLNDRKVFGGSPIFGDFTSFYANPNYGVPEGVQSQIVAPNTHVPVYSKNKFFEPKVEFKQMYAPNYQGTTNLASTFQSAQKVSPNVAQTDTATVNVNGKKVPVPILKLQSTQEYPNFLHAFENQPLVLSTNLDYQAQPIFEYNFGRTKPNTVAQLNVNTPYSSPIVGFQAQVVPIQTASSTPQFPQYRGASVNTYPAINNQRSPATYEPIQSQPQLHFGSDGVVVPVNTHQAVYHNKPAEDIREDVEVIKKKKKKPPPPPPEQDDSRDEELDEGYKQIEREYGRYPNDDEDDDSQSNKYYDSKSEGDFEPSKSYPFKAYDEKFGKYAKHEDKDDTDEPRSKYRSYSSNEDDDSEDEKPKYRNDYSSSKPRFQKYEEEEESGEETHKRETRVEPDEDADYEVEPRELYRGKDFEREFEESYSRELPQNKYVHVKEVPDIDESTYLSRGSSKSSRNQSREKNKQRGQQESSDEPKTQGSRSSHSYRLKPRRTYGDSDGHGSAISTKKIPKVVHEESFGYKKTDDSFPKYTKKYDLSGKHASSNNPPKDSYGHVTRTSYKVGAPKSAASSGYGNGEVYSYSSGRKYSESIPEDTYKGAGSIGKDSPKLAEHISFQSPVSSGPKIRSLTTDEVLRTLKGI